MLKVYAPLGAPLISSSAGRCFFLLEELGLEYEPVFIDFKKGENKTEEYLKLNPNGKIPTLVDDQENFVLWESMAINNYLCEKYKPELLGESLNERANIIKWNYWIISEYQVPIVQLLIQTRFMPEEKRDNKVIDSCFEKISKLNKILNDNLKDKEFIAGNKISVADFNIGPVASSCFMLKVDLSNTKNFTRWITNISSRESFRKLMK